MLRSRPLEDSLGFAATDLCRGLGGRGWRIEITPARTVERVRTSMRPERIMLFSPDRSSFPPLFTYTSSGGSISLRENRAGCGHVDGQPLLWGPTQGFSQRGFGRRNLSCGRHLQTSRSQLPGVLGVLHFGLWSCSRVWDCSGFGGRADNRSSCMVCPLLLPEFSRATARLSFLSRIGMAGGPSR